MSRQSEEKDNKKDLDSNKNVFSRIKWKLKSSWSNKRD